MHKRKDTSTRLNSHNGDSSKESYTKESTATKQEQRKKLPATGGVSLLLSVGALLLGTGLIVSVVLRGR